MILYRKFFKKIDKAQAPYLVKSDLHHLLENDKRLTPPQIKQWTKRELQSQAPKVAYFEPGAPDITAETIFDLYSTVKGGQAVLPLSRHLFGSYFKHQAAKRVIRFSSKQLRKKIYETFYKTWVER